MMNRDKAAYTLSRTLLRKAEAPPNYIKRVRRKTKLCNVTIAGLPAVVHVDMSPEETFQHRYDPHTVRAS